ncbi:hypothetical protein ACWEP4_42715, partial [Streptomyces sp. NPDC004227]
RPWERPSEPRRLTPARVRRGFRNVRATAARPARRGRQQARSADGGRCPDPAGGRADSPAPPPPGRSGTDGTSGARDRGRSVWSRP